VAQVRGKELWLKEIRASLQEVEQVKEPSPCTLDRETAACAILWPTWPTSAVTTKVAEKKMWNVQYVSHAQRRRAH
jgi:hypothetical protein